MKIARLLTAAIIIISAYSASAQVTALQVDSLRQQLDSTKNDTVKAEINRKIASHYMNYQILVDKRTRRIYQENAINYTIQAIHAYSRYNDTLGLRNSFNSLVKLYREQKKYSQAKWFILQSNAISRQRNDVPGIISSLIELAAIKAQIKDYSLAMRDLNEALSLSSKHKMPKHESEVQTAYAMLYTKMDDPKKAAAANKRHDAILDSMLKGEMAQQVAETKTQDSVQQVKKKLYTYTTRKNTKANSARKTVSL
jgi:tetratricopeptide (TPR) repeat protein